MNGPLWTVAWVWVGAGALVASAWAAVGWRRGQRKQASMRRHPTEHPTYPLRCHCGALPLTGHDVHMLDRETDVVHSALICQPVREFLPPGR